MSVPPPDPYATQQYPAQYPSQQYPVPYQAPSNVPPLGPPGGYPAVHPGYAAAYPEESRATLALILGILGVTLFSLCAPFAWWFGLKDKQAVDAGRRDPTNRGYSLAGMVLGIIGTALLALTGLFLIGYFVVLIALFGSAAATSG